MIFDSLIEDSLKSVRGLLTKQRLAIFAIALTIIAPKNVELLEAIQKNSSIADLTSQFTSAITTLPAVTTILLAFVIFFLSAILHQLISKTSHKLQAKRLTNIINQLKELELQPDLFFKERSMEIATLWKSEKETAEAEIKRMAALSECFISAAFVCICLSIQHNQSFGAVILLTACALLYSIDTSNKTLMEYLKHIATYKIAIARINKIKKENKTPDQ